MSSVKGGRVLRSELFCGFLVGQLACHLLSMRLDLDTCAIAVLNVLK